LALRKSHPFASNEANFGNTFGSEAAVSDVPEPMTLYLAIVALAALPIRRRK
jgi:hypothetical protein